MDTCFNLLRSEIFLGSDHCDGIKSQLTRLIVTRMFSNETRKYMGVCKSAAQEGKAYTAPHSILNIETLMEFATCLWAHNPSFPSILPFQSGEVGMDCDEMVYRCRFLSWIIFGTDVIQCQDSAKWMDYATAVEHMSACGLATKTQKKEFLRPVVPRDAKATLLCAKPFAKLDIPRSKLSFAIESRVFETAYGSCYDLYLVPIYISAPKSVTTLFERVIDETSIVVPGPVSVSCV
jgi:hypothetical protein